MLHIVHSFIFSATFHFLVSLQRYSEVPFFQTDLTAAHLFLDRVRVSEACVSTGLMSTLYINVLVCFEVKWDLRCFLSPWKHLFAARISFLNFCTDVIFTVDI